MRRSIIHNSLTPSLTLSLKAVTKAVLAVTRTQIAMMVGVKEAHILLLEAVGNTQTVIVAVRIWLAVLDGAMVAQ